MQKLYEIDLDLQWLRKRTSNFLQSSLDDFHQCSISLPRNLGLRGRRQSILNKSKQLGRAHL